MTDIQAVCTVAATAVIISIGLIVAGVAILAGVGWSLVVAGALAGPSVTAAAVVLLREDKSR